MSVEVKRKKQESFDAFLRRFNKKLLQSGRLFQARKIRFHQRPLSRNKTKMLAARRRVITGQKDYLKKIGKLPEERGRHRSRR